MDTLQVTGVELCSAVHSFSTTFHKNGNITIIFYEGNKRRDIKLVMGTTAHDLYSHYHYEVGGQTYGSDEAVTKESLHYLRRDFNFKKHPNNPSVFYPKTKE
jgi:hypothetical protein